MLLVHRSAGGSCAFAVASDTVHSPLATNGSFCARKHSGYVRFSLTLTLTHLLSLTHTLRSPRCGRAGTKGRASFFAETGSAAHFRYPEKRAHRSAQHCVYVVQPNGVFSAPATSVWVSACSSLAHERARD